MGGREHGSLTRAARLPVATSIRLHVAAFASAPARRWRPAGRVRTERKDHDCNAVARARHVGKVCAHAHLSKPLSTLVLRPHVGLMPVPHHARSETRRPRAGPARRGGSGGACRCQGVGVGVGTHSARCRPCECTDPSSRSKEVGSRCARSSPGVQMQRKAQCLASTSEERAASGSSAIARDDEDVAPLPLRACIWV